MSLSDKLEYIDFIVMLGFVLFILLTPLITVILSKIMSNKEKQSKKKTCWTIRWDVDEIDIEHPENFRFNFDELLDDLEMGRISFIVLAPPTPIGDISFIQVAQNENGLMHVEVGTTEPGQFGTPKILYKDDVSTGEVLDMFLNFFEKGEIDIEGWKELEFIYRK